MRAALRVTQLAEQLVEVPMIVSSSLLQRIVEQNVDIPVLGHGGRFLLVFKVFALNRVQQRLRPRSLTILFLVEIFPVQG